MPNFTERYQEIVQNLAKLIVDSADSDFMPIIAEKYTHILHKLENFDVWEEIDRIVATIHEKGVE
jgi:hypothetical protein